MVPTLPTNVPVPVHMQRTSALNFDKHASDTFTLIDDFVLENVLDNIILVRYVDTPDSNQTVMRNGILVPIDHTKAAWRIGQIILELVESEYNISVEYSPDIEKSYKQYLVFPNDLPFMVKL